jgi:hypothetical protein
MTADVFYVELARKAHGPLVELAIGNGRVAIPVVRTPPQRYRRELRAFATDRGPFVVGPPVSRLGRP